MSDQDNNTPAPDAEVLDQDLPETDEQLEGEDLEGDAAVADLTPKEVQKLMKSYEFKANGKTRKVEIDLNDDESVRKWLEKGVGAEEKWQEASGYRKQAEQLVEMLQKNPRAILKNPALGIDVRKLAEELLDEQLEDAKLTPEQKELRDLKASIAEREKKESEYKKQQDEQKQAQMIKEQQEKIESDMMSALDASSLGASPYTVRRTADIMSALIEQGYEDVDIKKVMPFVEHMIKQELSGHIGKHRDPAKLENLVGKDILKEYRKSKIAPVKKTPNSSVQESGKKLSDNKPVEKKPIKISELGDW